jgi:hypothetical protein
MSAELVLMVWYRYDDAKCNMILPNGVSWTNGLHILHNESEFNAASYLVAQMRLDIWEVGECTQ